MSRTLQPGDTVREWTIEKRLGGGGQAITWLARDASGKRVALKQLVLKRAESLKEIELFEREAAVLASLDHPAIPRFFDAFEERTDDDSIDFFLVQTFVDAPSIAALLAQGHTFDTTAFVGIARAALTVLGWLHQRQPPVIHRDIKPSNLLLDAEKHLHVIDFGAVRAHLPLGHEGESTIVGTHGYMPPEQLMGRASPVSDLYALGATLVHIASGHHPGRLPLDGLRLRFRDVVTLPPPLVAWLETMVAPDPGARPASAEAAIRGLDMAYAQSQQPPPPETTTAPRRSRRRSDAGLALAGLLLVLTGAAIIAVWPSPEIPLIQNGKLPVPQPPRQPPPTPPRPPSPFVNTLISAIDHPQLRIVPRRAMLRRSEPGFPMSSLDVALEVTSLAKAPITSLELMLTLNRFRQESRLLVTFVGDLNVPLEPGETRIVVTRFTDVTNTIDRIEARVQRLEQDGAGLPASTPTLFKPTHDGLDVGETLETSMRFELLRDFVPGTGHATEGRRVVDIAVTAVNTLAFTYFEMRPRCHRPGEAPVAHTIADSGLQLSPGRLFPNEGPWAKAGDRFTYRAICPAGTKEVTWAVRGLQFQ